MNFLLYSVIFLNNSFRLFIIVFSSFRLSFLYAKYKPTLEYHLYRSTKNALTPIYPKNIQVILSEENIPPPKYMSTLMNQNTLLNLNLASYFLNILASPYASTWFTTGGPITKTIKNPVLKIYCRKTVERTWHMVNRCKEIEQESTGVNSTRHFFQPCLLSNPDELNILADAMEKNLASATQPISSIFIATTTVLMQCNSTVNLYFLRLQTKRKRRGY